MKRVSFLSAVVGAAVILLSGHAASAQCIAPPSVETAEPAALINGARLPIPTDTRVAAGPASQDYTQRVVAPVHIGGRGPFRFIIDTGANRSVLSQSLAASLGLTSTGSGEVNSIDGVTVAPLVEVSSFNYGALNLPSAPMPVLQGGVFAGEQGLLGVDGMEGRRLRIDFEHGCVEIRPSQGAPTLRGWASVRGRLAFGHLVVVPGNIAGVRINVIIDTGADASLANIALRRALQAHITYSQDRLDRARAWTAGLPIILDSAIATPRLRIGNLDVDHVVAYVGDFHIFDLWGLQQEPTLLLGMDVISHARGIAIDYARGIVWFQTEQSREVLIESLYSASRFSGLHN